MPKLIAFLVLVVLTNLLCPTVRAESLTINGNAQKCPSFYVLVFTKGWGQSSSDCVSYFDRTKQRFGRAIKVINANVDDSRNDEFVKTVGVQAIPTAIVLDQSGQRVKTLIGADQCLSLNIILETLLPSELNKEIELTAAAD